MRNLKIILDAMGGDNGPDANIKGAVNAVNKLREQEMKKDSF